MPKVKEEYYLVKENEILDAAYKVCLSKPIHDVTMKDVVNASGLSRGGVYKYFANIDDVIIRLVNREYKQYDFEGDIQSIISAKETPQRIISDIFTYLAKHNADTLVSYGKIHFEIMMLSKTNPERYGNMISKLTVAKGMNLFVKSAFEYIMGQVTAGFFKPIIPLSELFSYIMVCYDGIVRDCTLTKCYPTNDNDPVFDMDNLMSHLCTCTLFLLGGGI